MRAKGRGALVLVLLATGVLLAASAEADAIAEERLKWAVDSLKRQQTESGLLRYDFHFLSDAPSGEDDGVRQAAVVAFLAEYMLESRDASIAPTVARALERFDALSLPVGKRRLQRVLEWSGLFSIPFGRYKLLAGLTRLGLLYTPEGSGRVIALDGDYAKAYSGAAAMALFAELHYAQATGDRRFETARAGWLKGLETLYVPRAGFRFTPATTGSSPFSDGEAWLALAAHDRWRPGDPLVQKMLGPLEDYLLKRYTANFSITFYQWGAMAAAVRWDATRDPRFATFLQDQAAHALTSLARPTPPYNTCATMEGVLTAARVLHETSLDPELVRRLVDQAREHMRKNFEFQIAPNSGRRQFTPATAIVSPRLEHFAGAFLHEPWVPYTRIDFTGHCVSALVKLVRYERATK